MNPQPLHSWDLTPKEAAALQRELAAGVDSRTPLTHCRLLAGADISYNRFDPTVYAAIVVLNTADWSIVDTASVVGPSRFPYVPGLLSFRESPFVIEAFAKLRVRPDAIMLDGQGYAHPRRFGLACHLGLWLDLPCFGCAKSVLVGKFREPGKKPGSLSPLRDGDEIVGQVVRTKFDVRPVFVSVGHKIDLASAVRWTLASSQGYRIPEPTRQAHLHVNRLRQAAKG